MFQRPRGFLATEVEAQIDYFCTDDKCDEKFTSIQAWRNHEMAHDKPAKWRCHVASHRSKIGVCANIFMTEKAFRRHLHGHGLDAAAIESGVKEDLMGEHWSKSFWCGFCRAITVPTKALYPCLDHASIRMAHVLDHFQQGLNIDKWLRSYRDVPKGRETDEKVLHHQICLLLQCRQPSSQPPPTPPTPPHSPQGSATSRTPFNTPAMAPTSDLGPFSTANLDLGLGPALSPSEWEPDDTTLAVINANTLPLGDFSEAEMDPGLVVDGDVPLFSVSDDTSSELYTGMPDPLLSVTEAFMASGAENGAAMASPECYLSAFDEVFPMGLPDSMRGYNELYTPYPVHYPDDAVTIQPPPLNYGDPSVNFGTFATANMTLAQTQNALSLLDPSERRRTSGVPMARTLAGVYSNNNNNKNNNDDRPTFRRLNGHPIFGPHNYLGPFVDVDSDSWNDTTTTYGGGLDANAYCGNSFDALAYDGSFHNTAFDGSFDIATAYNDYSFTQPWLGASRVTPPASPDDPVAGSMPLSPYVEPNLIPLAIEDSAEPQLDCQAQSGPVQRAWETVQASTAAPTAQVHPQFSAASDGGYTSPFGAIGGATGIKNAIGSSSNTASGHRASYASGLTISSGNGYNTRSISSRSKASYHSRSLSKSPWSGVGNGPKMNRWYHPTSGLSNPPTSGSGYASGSNRSKGKQKAVEVSRGLNRRGGHKLKGSFRSIVSRAVEDGRLRQYLGVTSYERLRAEDTQRRKRTVRELTEQVQLHARQCDNDDQDPKRQQKILEVMRMANLLLLELDD